MERRTFLKEAGKYTVMSVAGLTLLQSALFAKTGEPELNKLLYARQNHDNMLNNIVYENVSTTVKLRGRDVRIHALCTGTVAVKNAFRTKRGPGALAKLNMLFDGTYTDYMPIWVWVIEHPEGIMIIDTGETALVNDRQKYLARENAFSRYISEHTAQFIINDDDSLEHQLDKVNIKIQDVKLVVLTHLHIDHTDGIRFFAKTEIMVNRFEFEHPYHNVPTTYPAWFKPKLVDYKQNQAEIFERAYPVTAAGDLLYVPTPGHTHGHSSVIFKTDDFDIVFAGDATYNQNQLLNHELAGVNADFDKTKNTYKNLLAYGALRKTIYLPSHDEESGKRLAQRQFLI